MTLGVCKVDGCSCEGDDLVCRLNPKETHPVEWDKDAISYVDFVNKRCSNFAKVKA